MDTKSFLEWYLGVSNPDLGLLFTYTFHTHSHTHAHTHANTHTHTPVLVMPDSLTALSKYLMFNNLIKQLNMTRKKERGPAERKRDEKRKGESYSTVLKLAGFSTL